MSTQLHPVLDAVASIDVALKSVADVNPTFMTTTEKATALTDLVRAESRLAELKMRILADADDLARGTAAHDPAAWLAVTTRTRHEDARADHTLAVALDRRWTTLAAALRAGETTLAQAQAQVITRALDSLPAEVPEETLAKAEATLVGHASDFGPRQLARIGRRILDTVAPHVADAIEARRLADLETHARDKTRLTLRRQGDGTTRITGLLPDATATRLATYLEAYTNPRKANDETSETRDPFTRLPYPRRLGQAFSQLLETIDPSRLPLHGGDATTLVVTIGLDQLRQDLASAEIIGGSHVPGSDEPAALTAAEARRLACTAQIIPAVLGGNSEILDLGRTRRLFNTPQRKALLLRDRTCRAEGCDTPGTWCHAHHWHPWAQGGHTNLHDGVLLCHHHHQRTHDPHYTATRLPNGDVRYTRRT